MGFDSLYSLKSKLCCLHNFLKYSYYSRLRIVYRSIFFFFNFNFASNSYLISINNDYKILINFASLYVEQKFCKRIFTINEINING